MSQDYTNCDRITCRFFHNAAPHQCANMVFQSMVEKCPGPACPRKPDLDGTTFQTELERMIERQIGATEDRQTRYSEQVRLIPILRAAAQELEDDLFNMINMRLSGLL